MKASDLPLSILIVGVGGADFKEMEVSHSLVFVMLECLVLQYRLFWSLSHTLNKSLNATTYYLHFRCKDFGCWQGWETWKFDWTCGFTWYSSVCSIPRCTKWVFFSFLANQLCVVALAILSRWAVTLLWFAGGEISVVQALLAELPSQFLTYMRSRDVKPILWSCKELYIWRFDPHAVWAWIFFAVFFPLFGCIEIQMWFYHEEKQFYVASSHSSWAGCSCTVLVALVRQPN